MTGRKPENTSVIIRDVKVSDESYEEKWLPEAMTSGL
jgi:hypothetical protein